MPDWIAILAEPLPTTGPKSAVSFVADRAAGGIALFLGVTRQERSAGGQELAALDYEAYPEMAEQQLEALAKQARARWPILKLAILHRTGRVGVGEPSVAIAISTPHRAEAFEACRFLIDELKKDVAIWKKEVWADGGESWVHPEMAGRADLESNI